MKFNDALQWFGAVFIMIGHLLNTLGIIAFLIWTIRVSNKPQMTVNIMALIFMGFGLVKFFT